MTTPNMERLMTRTDFVGTYVTSHTTLRHHIQNSNITVHLVGTTIYIDIDDALAALGNPPLRSQARALRTTNLFA